MMTVTVFVSIFVIGTIKILMTCLPTGVVEKIHKKFEIHSKLVDEDTVITFEGKTLEGEEKAKVIHSFNESNFLEKKYIFPGNEHLFLEPEDVGSPIIIDTKKGKTSIRLYLFIYNDRVDVVKQYKKKLISYSISSNHLQKSSHLVIGELI